MLKSKKFIYKNTLKWQEEKKGQLSSCGKPDITVATPPEFKGHAGIWSPEDLFVASVNSCIMTTFLYYTEKENLKILNYESHAEGVLERIGDKFVFSAVKIQPRILVRQGNDIQKIKNIIEHSEKNCLISSSIKSKVIIKSEILTEGTIA